jgi:hypothetical protein
MNLGCSASCCPCLLLNAPELRDLRRTTGSRPRPGHPRWAIANVGRCDDSRRGLGCGSGFAASRSVSSGAVSGIGVEVSGRAAGHTGQSRTTWCRCVSSRMRTQNTSKGQWARGAVRGCCKLLSVVCWVVMVGAQVSYVKCSPFAWRASIVTCSATGRADYTGRTTNHRQLLPGNPRRQA